MRWSWKYPLAPAPAASTSNSAHKSQEPPRPPVFPGSCGGGALAGLAARGSAAPNGSSAISSSSSGRIGSITAPVFEVTRLYGNQDGSDHTASCTVITQTLQWPASQLSQDSCTCSRL